MSEKLLIVEDDKKLREELKILLEYLLRKGLLLWALREKMLRQRSAAKKSL